MSNADNTVIALLERARAAQNQRQYETAVETYRELIRADPHSWVGHFELGNLQRAAGDRSQALELYRSAIRIDGDRYEAHLNIGATYFDSGDVELAIAALVNAAARSGLDVTPHVNLGRIYLLRGEFGLAKQWLEAATAAQPSRADALIHLGEVLRAMSLGQAAIEAHKRAIKVAPQEAQAYLQAAMTLLQFGETNEALEVLSDAERLVPSDPQLHRLKIAALKQVSDPAALSRAVAQAFADCPDDPVILREVLALRGDSPILALARERLTILVKRTPTDIAGWKALAQDAYNEGAYERCMAILEDGVSASHDASLRLYAALTLPKVAASNAQIDAARAAMNRHLDTLIAGQFHIPNLSKTVNKTAFHLAYHGRDDRALQMKIAQAHLSACPILKWSAPHCRSKRVNRSRIRIGFISAFFRFHAVGRLVGHLIASLDRRRFEVCVIRPIGPTDDFGAAIDQSADRSITIPLNLAQAREDIAGLGLDILFYTDIGMEPFTYYLACARLAPIQIAWPGHPITTGIPEIDVFISSTMSEPADGDAAYSERLVRLSKLPGYEQSRIDDRAPDLHATLNLPPGPLYVCAMTLYKFHPDMDLIFGEIMRRDPKGKLVIIGDDSAWHAGLRARMLAAAPELAGRLVVLPFLNKPRFLSLLRAADVVLDTVHFGGGNTSRDAFAMGTPIATLQGKFLRSRTTAGMHRQMGLEHLTTNTTEDYVDRAVRLANDSDFRLKVSEDIRAARGALFEDSTVLGEYEDKFIELLETARPGSHGDGSPRH